MNILNIASSYFSHHNNPVRWLELAFIAKAEPELMVSYFLAQYLNF